jgi:hypothetical protein
MPVLFTHTPAECPVLGLSKIISETFSTLPARRRHSKPRGVHPVVTPEAFHHTIKCWMGYTHFQMKTLKHVGTEMALHVETSVALCRAISSGNLRGRKYHLF